MPKIIPKPFVFDLKLASAERSYETSVEYLDNIFVLVEYLSFFVVCFSLTFKATTKTNKELMK